MNVAEKLHLLKNGKLTATQNVKNFLKKIKKENSKINAFIDVRPELSLGQAEYLDKNRGELKDKKLFGLCIAVKAAINVKKYNISCASNTLRDYISPYDATVIRKIKDAGGIVIGITNCDEFCCGSSGETSAFGATKNPSCLDRIPGGSSSGSVAAVAAGFCDLALGSDTGGSIRNPASHCGVVGMKSTYGMVSRYGLIDLSMSLEQIGPISKDVCGCELLFDVIKGKDERDSTTFKINEKIGKINKIKIGVPKINADEKIWKLVRERISAVCKKQRWKSEDIELKHIDLGVQTYYPINYVEFFSATRKFDGRKYGRKIEENCGDEVLRRILGGSEIAKAEFAGKYYRKALQAKRLIEQEFEECFEKKGFDCLIMPTVPKLPHKLGGKLGIEEMYMYDTLTVLANLAGVPAISLPAGKIDNVPVGMQIICARFEDKKMLEIAKRFE